jgi:hypothetical protein
MGTWNGDAILVQHTCGQRVWCEPRRVGDGYVMEFRTFAVIGPQWWKGDVITTCPRCGESFQPFMSKQWIEA